jgi:hypothetical protein
MAMQLGKCPLIGMRASRQPGRRAQIARSVVTMGRIAKRQSARIRRVGARSFQGTLAMQTVGQAPGRLSMRSAALYIHAAQSSRWECSLIGVMPVIQKYRGD